MAEDVLDPRELLEVARRRWWLLLAGPLLTGAVAIMLGVVQFNPPAPQPVYTAATVLFLEGKSGTDSYAQLASTRAVLSRAVAASDRSLSVGALRSGLSVEQEKDTRFLKIMVSNADRDLALAAADGVANSLIEQVEILRGAQLISLREDLSRQAELLDFLESPPAAQEITRALAADLNSRLVVIDPAEATYSAIAPPRFQGLHKLALALFLGVLVSLGMALTLEYTQNPLRSARRVGQRFGLKHLGSAPLVTRRGRPDPYPSEAVNLVATNLESVAASRQARVLLVASPQVGAGSDALVANLGVALAAGWQEVVLVDADLRRPTLQRFFQVDDRRGLGHYLSDPSAGSREALQETDYPRLKVIPAGPPAAHPLGLLKSPRMKRLLAELKSSGALVLLNAPPLEAVGDGLALAALADAVALLADSRHGRVAGFQLALDQLENVGADLLGFVWNGQGQRLSGGFSRSGQPYRQSPPRRVPAHLATTEDAPDTGGSDGAAPAADPAAVPLGGRR